MNGGGKRQKVLNAPQVVVLDESPVRYIVVHFLIGHIIFTSWHLELKLFLGVKSSI